MTKPDIYISVGSNIDPERHLRAALIELRATFLDIRVSPVYRSAAVGFVGDDFLNLVVVANTALSPSDVAKTLQEIEMRHGRDRGQPKFSSRTLDLDLLLYDDEIIDDGTLRLPRDEITRYGFVLAPLAAIAGEKSHPRTGERYDAMWREMAKKNEDLNKIPFAW